MEEYKFYGKIHVDWVDPDQVYYYNENHWCDELSDHEATASLDDVNQAIEKNATIRIGKTKATSWNTFGQTKMKYQKPQPKK